VISLWPKAFLKPQQDTVFKAHLQLVYCIQLWFWQRWPIYPDNVIVIAQHMSAQIQYASAASYKSVKLYGIWGLPAPGRWGDHWRFAIQEIKKEKKKDSTHMTASERAART